MIQNNEGMEHFMCSWLQVRPNTCYDAGITELPVQWQCLNLSRNYVEKRFTCTFEKYQFTNRVWFIFEYTKPQNHKKSSLVAH